MIIDGNALGHANHHATKLTVGAFQTQAIFGTLKTIHGLAKSYAMHDILTLWDGRAEHRYAEFPEYKANRETVDPEKLADKSAYQAQVPYLQKALETLGVKQIKAENLEADDLAGYFSVAMSKTRQILLVTGDSDWLQMVNENVSWLDPRGDGKFVNLANFLESTGYHTPKEYIQGKALIGDGTDGIGPVGGIGKQTAPLFMARFKSVEAFWQQCDLGAYKPTNKSEKSLWKGRSEFDKDQWAAKYTGPPTDKKLLRAHMNEWPGQGRALYERNWRLMNLLEVGPPDRDKLVVRPGEYNPEAFGAICARLGFQSILKTMPQFVEPFERRWEQRASMKQAA